MTKVIGKLTTTPDVGDPIVSPWYQQIATYARHIYDTKANLDTWADAPDGAHAYTTSDLKRWVRRSASWQQDGPQGVIGLVERNTNAGPISGAAAAISGMTFTVTTTSQRYLRVSAFTRHFIGAAATDYGALEIRNQSNTIVADGIFTCVTAGGTPLGDAMLISRVAAVAAGSLTYTLWLTPSAGSITVAASLTTPMWMTLEDLGPA